MLSNEEIRERQKREAAAREAGRLVVCVASGGSARAWLWETNTDDPRKYAAWLGNTKVVAGEEGSAVAVAGPVAAMLAYRPDASFEQCLYGIYVCEVLPDTDDGPTLRDAQVVIDDVEIAFDLLKANKVFFDWAVEKLCSEEI